MQTLFEAKDISRSFGPVQALRGVSLDLRRGEVHAVIGENGAGKSTLMNIISGKLPPSSGSLWREGRQLHLSTPRDAQAAGICICPQEIFLADHLTVAENILLGSQVINGAGVIRWDPTAEEAARHLQRIDRTIDVKAQVGTLNKAQQQLVQIARAVATKADILIFDEPTAALSSKETERLYEFIKAYTGAGNSIFYISHRLDEILALSDRVTVLRDGQHVGELQTSETSKDEMVRHMAGRAVKIARRETTDLTSAPAILRVKGLTRPGEFRDISFDVHRGEVLGFAGLVGAGRTELAKCIFGITQPAAGSCEFDGEPANFRHPADAIARGLVYLPEERKAEGIFPALSIAENMGVSVFGRIKGVLGIRLSEIGKLVDQRVRELQIKIGATRDPITSLSGGNQQKVIIGRWLLHDSRLLILDEPTRGIDVNARSEIQDLLHKLTRSGLTVIYISSELQELIDVCDRIAVMHEGQLKGIVPAATANQPGLLALAMS